MPSNVGGEETMEVAGNGGGRRRCCWILTPLPSFPAINKVAVFVGMEARGGGERFPPWPWRRTAQHAAEGHQLEEEDEALSSLGWRGEGLELTEEKGRREEAFLFPTLKFSTCPRPPLIFLLFFPSYEPVALTFSTNASSAAVA